MCGVEACQTKRHMWVTTCTLEIRHTPQLPAAYPFPSAGMYGMAGMACRHIPPLALCRSTGMDGMDGIACRHERYVTCDPRHERHERYTPISFQKRSRIFKRAASGLQILHVPRMRPRRLTHPPRSAARSSRLPLSTLSLSSSHWQLSTDTSPRGRLQASLLVCSLSHYGSYH